MKSFCFCLLVLSGTIFHKGFAQTVGDPSALVKEGVLLNNTGDYAGAAGKYTEALKLDSTNLYADYGMAFSLVNLGKGDSGIPYLEKVIKSNSTLKTQAYDLLGTIYDQDHNSAKAIEAYDEGIKIDPKSQHLYYNLGLVYFKAKNYAEAEKCAVQSLKLDPTHANSQRMYALVCFHQNKRANALLGFCSFILLEPASARSTEAYGNIQHILKGGNLKAEPGVAAPVADANTTALNQTITKVTAETSKMSFADPADLLSIQLKAIFAAIGPLADSQTGNDFFKTFYADYFYKLSQSPNMLVFARMVSECMPESLPWIKSNAQAKTDFDNWLKATERKVE
jgi:tetratricopeptide (TPR) repeat protein